MDARLTLRPGTNPGEVVGEVVVTRTPMIFDANIQNFGSHDFGRWRGVARARFTGLTGMGDLPTLSVYTTADTVEKQVPEFAHESRVVRHRLRSPPLYTHAPTPPHPATPTPHPPPPPLTPLPPSPPH